MEHYKEVAVHEIKKFLEHLLIFLKWMAVSLFTGLVAGALGTLFSYGLSGVTSFRLSHGKIIWLLPVAGLLINFFYEKFGNRIGRGTNMALSAINSDSEIPFVIVPVIFVSSILSHLFGASVGREGAALQMGAGIGNALANILKFNENDKKLLIMTGMSAAFSALFGTPLAAAVFSMEVISVGIMHYAALVPCLVSALTAMNFAKFCGVVYADYGNMEIPEFTLFTSTVSVVLGFLFALVSIGICAVFALSERGFARLFTNSYVRVFLSGLFIAVCTFVIGNQNYNGLGSDMIHMALSGNTVWYAFLIKLIFTAVSLSGGYKGGEIVPILFIGATFGCLISQFIGMPPELCAALGMTAVFCGVTNTPISSLLIGIEMFHGQGMWFFALVIAVSYMLSGYYGLYKSQLIMYSKYRSAYVRKNALR